MASAYFDGSSPQNTANQEINNSVEQLQPVTTLDVDDNPSTAEADLSYKHTPRGHSLNNPPPQGWVYPHKKGIGTGSNLENFKADIEARTQRGENCKAIAEALNAMGVQTSDRAVSRVRIKWGMRKRAQRKVKTPPPGSEAARLSAKSKVQAMRKSELIRMTKAGMSAEEIYQNLTKRGMELKKGVATVLRLQSAWGLAHDEKRWLGNFRHQCHKRAKAQQIEAFTEIAKELRVQDMGAWMQEKMSGEAARLARHELALKLMGEHAPTNPERRKLQTPRRTDGPYDRPAGATGGAELSDSETSESDADSDVDSPAQAKWLRSDVADAAGRKGEADHNSGGPSSEVGNGDGGSVDQSSFLDGMGMDMDDGYAPLNDQGDHDIPDAEGDYVEPDSVEGGQGLSTATATFSPNTFPPTSQTASAENGIDPQRSPSTTAVTPVSRDKGRPPKQSAAKPSPVPTPGAGTSHMPTKSFSNSEGPPLSVIPHLPSETSATTSPTFALQTPMTARAATTSASPTPQLILCTEEAEANKSTISALDQYNAAASVYKELLEARNENKALPGSLTGLPPSAKEVDTAKRKLKEATQAMMLALD
ncbi:hypothetical protein VM1G_04629 [Cytospora mali]|uniref:Uncharacterized protein n=1 Tax=Cytospora mali TaxID=578113 RepID=A0A194VWI0_CYTMA|nr:hypothetical protein VM1G_04629 [Valsa mali]